MVSIYFSYKTNRSLFVVKCTHSFLIKIWLSWSILTWSALGWCVFTQTNSEADEWVDVCLHLLDGGSQDTVFQGKTKYSNSLVLQVGYAHFRLFHGSSVTTEMDEEHAVISWVTVAHCSWVCVTF